FGLDNSSPCSPYEKSLCDQIKDAERLLNYAAEIGKAIDDRVRHDVLNAKATIKTNKDQWDKQTADNVLLALTSLSETLRPVTAESLKTCTDQTFYQHIRLYKWTAGFLAILIILFSLATFINSGISKDNDTDITKGNDLAVKLGNQSRAKNDS